MLELCGQDTLVSCSVDYSDQGFRQEYVGRLYIPVQDIEIVQNPQSVDHLYQDSPHLRLPKKSLLLLAFHNLAQQVPSICILHHEAQRLALRIVKGLTEPNDARVADTGQDTHFVDCVEPGFICELREVLYLLQGITLIVFNASHEVNHRVLTVANLSEDFEI